MFKIASGLSLPNDAVTQTFALLGRRGSGKTSTAVVLAEEFLKAEQPIIWIDPIGVAWGLRSKFKILIAGGEHGDIPLDPGGGRAMAEFLVDSRVPTILDVGTFGEGQMKRFVADFGQAFYELNRDPVHLFFDEADEFAPQSSINGDAAKSLGAMQRLVRRGRARGIGVTLISQRSAVLNKSVLTQTECLFALQTTGPQDLDAIREWLKHHGTAEETAEILCELPKLQQGEGFVYSPGWLKVLKRVKVRPRETFDSSRTPKAGETREKPKTLAEVDLKGLSGQMARAIQEAKENDPKALRARVRELEERLENLDSDPVAEKLAVDQLRQHEENERLLLGRIEDLRATVVEAGERSQALAGLLENMRQRIAEPCRLTPAEDVAKPGPVDKRSEGQKILDAKPRRRREVDVRDHSDKIGLPGQRILDALAWWESIGNNRPTRGQVGFVAGYAANGGSFKTYLSRLSASQLIESGGGLVSMTDGGREIAKTSAGAKTLREYHQRILEVVKSEPLVKILESIIQQRGRGMHRNDIARLTGYEAEGGSFKTYMSRVSALGLIENRRGQVEPTSLLFPEGLK